jgi:hypothetical protein
MCEQQELDSLLSSIVRADAPVMDGHDLTQDGTSPRQDKEEMVKAGYHRRRDIEARFRRVETRLAYVGVSLSYTEVCRSHMELRLEGAEDDVAHTGDVGLAFEELRLQYADDYYSASSGDGGLLGQVDAAQRNIRARLIEIEAHLAQASSGSAYIGAEVGLSDVEAALADIEVSLLGIGATLAHVDALLWDVGVGIEAPSVVRRIPLPSEIAGYRSGSGRVMATGAGPTWKQDELKLAVASSLEGNAR